LTGPVYIEGAEPGDAQGADQQDRAARGGTNFNVPGMFGQFPSKFPEGQVEYFTDLERKVAEFAPGIEAGAVPRHPAARAERAIQLSAAGTLRRKYRCPRADRRGDLYVPVFVGRASLGRRFARGAGQRRDQPHRARDRVQGNERDRRKIKNMPLEWPRIETKDAWITLASTAIQQGARVAQSRDEQGADRSAQDPPSRSTR
jgi:hypothetical protein